MSTTSGISNANSTGDRKHKYIQGVHGVRYQISDVARAVEFYTTQLGFTLEHQQLPAFPERHGDRPGGKQIQVEDPDGNPIELFEPAR